MLHKGRNAVAYKDRKSSGRKGSATAGADPCHGRVRQKKAQLEAARPLRAILGGKKGRPEPPHKSCWEGNILKEDNSLPQALGEHVALLELRLQADHDVERHVAQRDHAQEAVAFKHGQVVVAALVHPPHRLDHGL
jgi:hypothetical protein